MKSEPRLKLYVIIIFFVVFIPSSFNVVLNAISLYGLIPLLFLVSILRDPSFLLRNRPIFYYFLLLCWSLITLAKARDIELGVKEIRLMLGVFLLCYVLMYYSLSNIKYVYIFYSFFIIKFFTLFYYGYTHGLTVSEERLDLVLLNANMFGYFGFFSIISGFFLFKYVSQSAVSKILLYSLFLICIIGSIASCFFAASRAGIAFSLILSISLIITDLIYPFKRRSIIGISIVVVVVVLLIPILSSYYEGSMLQHRFQVSVQEDSRYVLITSALDVGLKNPVFGVGPGNFMLYNSLDKPSHSSYTELFANSGLLALMIYLSLIYYFFKKIRRIFLLGKEYYKSAVYFLAFFILFCLYNLFYPFYLQVFLMGYFFVILAHIEIIVFKGYKQDREQENQIILL